MVLRKALLAVITFVLFAAGSVTAVQSEGLNEYEWKPRNFQSSYPLTELEFRLLQFTAHENTGGTLTAEIRKIGLNPIPYPNHLLIVVQTECQPDWEHYHAEGGFDVPDGEVTSIYEEAAGQVMASLDWWVPGIDAASVRIDFYILDSPVGTWMDGRMKLTAR